MMRNIELPKFSGAVSVVLEAVFLEGLKNGAFQKLSEETKYNNKIETTLITQHKYNGFQYIFKLDEVFSIYRVAQEKVDNQETDREHIITATLASPAQWEKFKLDGKFKLMSSHRFVVSNISLVKKMMIDLGLNHFDDKYDLFEDDMKVYDFGFKRDIDIIFSSADLYKKKLNLHDDWFHQYTFGNKKVISHTNTSACLTTFILYELNTDTGTIRVFEELEENVDEKKFPHSTIIIGKYPKIVEHYIENSEPCVIIENGNIIKNDNPHLIISTSFNAHALANNFSIEKAKPYDISRLSSVMEYMSYENINLLYSYGLWSSAVKWKLNEQGEYYIAFSDEMISEHKRSEAIIHDSNDYGYISTYSSKSAMFKLPNGKVAKEWLDLVVKSHSFVSKYIKKMAVCEVTKKDLDTVETWIQHQHSL